MMGSLDSDALVEEEASERSMSSEWIGGDPTDRVSCSYDMVLYLLSLRR